MKNSKLNSIFSKFKKQKPRVSDEEAIAQAEEISRNMIEGKRQAREDFVNTLLKNIQERNKAMNDFTSEEQKEEN